MTEIQNTWKPDLFGAFEFGIFDIVSNFEFSISDFHI